MVEVELAAQLPANNARQADQAGAEQSEGSGLRSHDRVAAANERALAEIDNRRHCRAALQESRYVEDAAANRYRATGEGAME